MDCRSSAAGDELMLPENIACNPCISFKTLMTGLYMNDCGWEPNYKPLKNVHRIWLNEWSVKAQL